MPEFWWIPGSKKKKKKASGFPGCEQFFRASPQTFRAPCRPAFEPRHDKTNKMTVRPAKTQISLIRFFAVRSMGSEGLWLSSCGQRRLWSDWADAQADADSEDSDQTGWITSHTVGFVMRQLISFRPWWYKTSRRREVDTLSVSSQSRIWQL